MMEPVAWHRSSDFCFHFSLGSEWPKNGTSNPDEWEPLVRLSDAEERIAELGAENQEFRTGIRRLSEEEELCGETMPEEDAFNLVRMAAKLAAAEARAEAAEALLKEAGPIIETFAQIGDYVLAETPAEATMWYAGHSCTGEHMAQVSLDHLRAARSIAALTKEGEQ